MNNEEKTVWESYDEWKMRKQWEIYRISQMFSTLKNFLWDIENSPEINLDGSETNSTFAL